MMANLSLITGLVLPYAMAKTSGSRSLEDILYLGETRGGRYYIKISRKLALDMADRVARNDSLFEVVQGELALRGIRRDPNKSDKDYYFELFGRSWQDVHDKDWEIETDNTGYGGLDFDEMKYTAQKHIFKDSIWSGATYYIKFKPSDMYDPIEENGFALQGRDAVLNLQHLYTQRDFLVKKYGNRDRFKHDLAMTNIERMGYQKIGDITQAGANHRATPRNFQRIKTSIESSGVMQISDDQVHLVDFFENIWKKAWTIDARKDARKRAKRIKG